MSRKITLLFIGMLVSAAAGDSKLADRVMATLTVQVLKQGVAENQGIRLDIQKVNVGVGDFIKIQVDSGVWCPGPGGASGTVTAAVPVNGCGFAAGNQTITEGGVLDKTIGPAGGGVTNFVIPITYGDADCGQNDGPATVNLAVNCNGVDKGCCVVIPTPGADPIRIEDITQADCMAQPGTKVWNTDVCVPTLSEWGVAVMGLLVLTSATIVIRRRRLLAAN